MLDASHRDEQIHPRGLLELINFGCWSWLLMKLPPYDSWISSIELELVLCHKSLTDGQLCQLSKLIQMPKPLTTLRFGISLWLSAWSMRYLSFVSLNLFWQKILLLRQTIFLDWSPIELSLDLGHRWGSSYCRIFQALEDFRPKQSSHIQSLLSAQLKTLQ